jgi:DNA invertase Pin-like site-specific DNA recombinase
VPSAFGEFPSPVAVEWTCPIEGKSGLGLEAQREAVLTYLDGGRWSLVQEFVEVESGKRNDRPELTAALAACKKHKAKLIIGSLIDCRAISRSSPR